MRQTLHSALSGLIAASGYFLLADFVRPALEERHSLVAWWIVIGLYVALLFGYGYRSILRAMPGMVVTGFLLLAATAYLYDPTIEPHLASVGLRWLWVAPFGGFFLWLFVLVKRVRKDRQQKGGR